jgi:hypothetical protein
MPHYALVNKGRSRLAHTIEMDDHEAIRLEISKEVHVLPLFEDYSSGKAFIDVFAREREEWARYASLMEINIVDAAIIAVRAEDVPTSVCIIGTSPSGDLDIGGHVPPSALVFSLCLVKIAFDAAEAIAETDDEERIVECARACLAEMLPKLKEWQETGVPDAVRSIYAALSAKLDGAR